MGGGGRAREGGGGKIEDETIIKLFGIGALTVLASVYFIMVKQDGAIFGTVATAIGTIIGYEVGKKRG